MKKIISLFVLSLLIINCSSSGNDDDPIVAPPSSEDGIPVAVNDNVSTIEDEELIMSDLLANDIIKDNAIITAFDAISVKGGEIIDNRGTFSYFPPKSFVGEDSFTYTLCDNDETPDCSTATVTITVTDEGNPTAVDDAINIIKNSTGILTTLLDNDTIIDDSEITSINSADAIGNVVLNEDGTITYTPQNEFIGTDTFTYTLCDDDSPDPSCETAIVTVTVHDGITFNIPSELTDYYNGLSFTDISDLMFNELEFHTITKHTTILSYGQRHEFLYNADEDESNADNVILMYTGESRYWEEYTSGTNSYSPQTFNTEHVYPQSLLNAADAVTDLHHLRSCDAGVNSARSNYPFIVGSGVNGTVGGNNWYPGDEWRGDVARMVMYLNIRYGENFDSVGGLDLFLEWNVLDPVSTFEIQRNNNIEWAQGNRNPFIDNPYLATLIWGGNLAENKWN